MGTLALVCITVTFLSLVVGFGLASLSAYKQTNFR